MSLFHLGNHSWILNPECCYLRTKLDQSPADGGRDLQLSFDESTRETRLEMVAARQGLGLLLNRPLLDQGFHRGTINIVEVIDFKADADLWLLNTSQVESLSEPARAFA